MRHVSNKVLLTITHMLLGIFLTLIMGMVIWGYGSLIESRFYPVVSQARIHSYESLEGSQTKLAFSATKFRECIFLKAEWFVGEQGGRAARVSSRFIDKPTVRGKGRHSWQGMIVDLPESLIRESSYAIVYHNCHPFWTTRTTFFIGAEDTK